MQKFDRDGKIIRQWGGFISLGDAGANATEAQTKFFGPRGVAIDAQNNVYVTDTGNRRVMEYDGNGTFIRQFAQGLSPALVSAPNNAPNQLNEPIGVAVDAQGNVYVADTNNRRIVKFDKSGNALTNWTVNAYAPGPYNEPFLAMGADGNLYASDPTGQQILKFDPTGKDLGSKKAQGTSTLSRPTGLTVAKDGTVYVVDTDKAGVVKLGTVP
jgi:sugar lactone lactonase YvrE